MSQDGVNKLESMCFIIFPWSKIISNYCFETILSLTIDKSADEISITILSFRTKILPFSAKKFGEIFDEPNGERFEDKIEFVYQNHII